MRNIPRPEKSEYPGYFTGYISQIKLEDNVLDAMEMNFRELKKLLSSLNDEGLLHRYAPGKWSIKELLVHIMDTERIFLVRALRIARNDQTPLPGFEQDDYVPFSGANELSKKAIFEEYEAIRKTSLAFFANLPEEAFSRSGMVNGHLQSVRAIAYQMAGHEAHHMNVLREKYL